MSVTLDFSADGNFCADSNGGDIALSNCTGSHAAYVIVEGGQALVSVGASNAFESEAGPNNPELAFDTPGGGGTRNPVGSLDQQDLEHGDVTFDDTWVESS